MKKRLLYLFCIGLLFLAPACSVQKKQTEKIKDLKFRVVREEDVPEELRGVMKEKGMEEFCLTYADQGNIYIAKGYGEREMTGYRVEVKACYETLDAICIQTELLGPSKEEKVVHRRMNPYTVIRMKDIGKEVRFE